MRDVLRPSPQRLLTSWGLFALVGVLLCFGALNIAVRVTSDQPEDGVFWQERPEGVTARDVAPRSGAMDQRHPAEMCWSRSTGIVESVDAVQRVVSQATPAERLSYSVLRQRGRLLSVEVTPVPGGNRMLYVVGSAIGIFTLLIGASVQLRRPHDPATLHFFWLCLAFFGTLTFSFSRLDRLDWYFYWADAVATLLLAPLFLHFTLVFPDRPSAWIRGRGRRLAGLFYLAPAGLLVAQCGAVGRLQKPAPSSRVLTLLDQIEPLSLGIHDCRSGGSEARDGSRALGDCAASFGGSSGAAFWAGPFALGYALPYALGLPTSLPMELLVIPLGLVPLAFASALVRYRLMDVEVIVKRSLVYGAVALAIFTIYSTLFRLIGVVFRDAADRHTMIIAMLATIVVVLLFSPLKSVIQNALDRAFYRDKYDYRRALVGFARDLNSDLDLNRLSERLVARIRETFAIDLMALLLVDEASGDFDVIRAEGFGDISVPGLGRHSQLAASLAGGMTLSLDDPGLQGAFPAEEVAFWRLRGVYFVQWVSKEAPSRCSPWSARTG
jgi:hypothetical protein